MQKMEFIFDKNTKQGVLDFLQTKIEGIQYGELLKCLKNKDIRINNIKISSNDKLNIGDKICIFLSDNKTTKKFYEVVFEDDNIIIVNKTAGIEVCDGLNSLKDLVETDFGIVVFAVHRLDANTSGLVVFAKNKQAKKELDFAFKNRTLEKYYLAEVFGIPTKEQAKLTAFLSKDEGNGVVKISANKKENSEKVITEYKVLKISHDTAVLEVNLITGKTHQIRAHLAHFGFPIIGDDKYGDRAKNKKYGQTKQNLKAYKIVFHFEENNVLSYLNNKTFELALPFKL